MKASSIVMIWVVIASFVCGETLQAAPKWGSKGKSIANTLADTVGMRRIITFFAKPADGGHSPARKTIAMAALASTCLWATVSMTGCGGLLFPKKRHTSQDWESIVRRNKEQEEIMLAATYLLGGVFVGVLIYEIAWPKKKVDNRPRHHKMFSNSAGIEQHHLAHKNLLNHSIIVDNETYEGVLITYRDGINTRTGLAFSPQASLVFTLQGKEQGMLGFVANSPSFELPEEIIVKPLDGEKTPDEVISLAQVENVVLTEEPSSQELIFSE